jgi:hypothetical protein
VSASITSRVSSTESVVWVTQPSLSDRAPAARPRPRRLDQVDPVGRVALRALDLDVAGVPDQHQLVALGEHPHRLDVHLGDERAGAVDRAQAARARRLADRGRHAVRAVDQQRAGGTSAGPR